MEMHVGTVKKDWKGGATFPSGAHYRRPGIICLSFLLINLVFYVKMSTRIEVFANHPHDDTMNERLNICQRQKRGMGLEQEIVFVDCTNGQKLERWLRLIGLGFGDIF
ncbi:hypothetical protein ACLOJK_015622 [Asimina triloba]